MMLLEQDVKKKIVLTREIPLSDILSYHSDLDPECPAITQDGVTISRKELDQRSNRRARLLAEHGVGVDDIVILSMPNSILLFEYTFAIWKLGATPCPVSPKLPSRELESIVALASPVLVVGREAEAIRSIEADFPIEFMDASALPSVVSQCWKIMTSGGSTGQPKLIATFTKGQFSSEGIGYLAQKPGCTILIPGPLYHNASFSAAHHCLFGGGHVVSMGKFDAELSLELIDEYEIEHVVFVPTMMSRISRIPAKVRSDFNVSSLKTVVHLGSACPKWLKMNWIDWLGPDKILEVYAGTEGVGSTAIRGDEWLTHPGSVGRPTSGVTLKVVNDAGKICKPGHVGEIQFWAGDASGVGFRYIGADLVVKDGWVSLGDLGYLDEDGYLYISDRRTDMIVSGGVNVFPAEIEAEIDKHPSVETCVVIGLPDEDLGSRAHAIVQTLSDSAVPKVEEMIEYLRHALVGYKIPRSYEFVSNDLRDENGKVRRSQLRAERISDTNT